MKRDEALLLLGLRRDTARFHLSPRSVMAAFAKAVRQAHPDTAAGAPSAPRASMAELKQARDMLLAGIVAENSACFLCKGVGKVMGKMGQRECAACLGTGIRR